MRASITPVWVVVAMICCGAPPADAETLEERRQRVFRETYRELEQVLSDPRSNGRSSAVYQLSALLGSTAEPPAKARDLVAWLERDADPRVARLATSLGQRLDGELTTPSPPPQAPAELFTTLGDASPKRRLSTLRRLMIYARRQTPEIDPRILGALEGALEDPDPPVRHYARFMLDGLAGDPRALEMVRTGESTPS